MLSLELLAEQRIREAIARGEFDNLPGAGRPLELDDDALIPEDLRVAYRILKNAGFVPPEVETLRQIADLERWLDQAADAEQRRKAILRISLLRAHLDSRPGARSALNEHRYAEKLTARFDRSGGSKPHRA